MHSIRFATQCNVITISHAILQECDRRITGMSVRSDFIADAVILFVRTPIRCCCSRFRGPGIADRARSSHTWLQQPYFVSLCALM